MAAAPTPTELQAHERQFREQQMEYRGNRRDRYERRVELEAVVRRARARPTDVILDAGCGLGRVTLGLLPSGAAICALDFAFNRLAYLRSAAPQPTLAHLRPVQADITRLPLAPASFSLIVCTQVLEHIPSPAARSSLLANFARLLRPRGRLILTVYNVNRGPREGRHETGVFFHCYDPAELASELCDFQSVRIRGLIHMLPHTYNLWPRLGPLGRACDHAIALVPSLSRCTGHLLLAEAWARSKRAVPRAQQVAPGARTQ